MATHSSILAWRIPWTEEPGGLCMVHGVCKDWDTTEGLTLFESHRHGALKKDAGWALGQRLRHNPGTAHHTDLSAALDVLPY